MLWLQHCGRRRPGQNLRPAGNTGDNRPGVHLSILLGTGIWYWYMIPNQVSQPCLNPSCMDMFSFWCAEAEPKARPHHFGPPFCVNLATVQVNGHPDSLIRLMPKLCAGGLKGMRLQPPECITPCLCFLQFQPRCEVPGCVRSLPQLPQVDRHMICL